MTDLTLNEQAANLLTAYCSAAPPSGHPGVWIVGNLV
jgi:hypothetical protein